ncbi:MAG TPA: hypothetical protein VJS92_03275 [Candidatus Polarisedimenticolaceae bacterium]|nr:hypothetical protein [Candidatus Polarisedimenticolaceae bacterium]
MRSLAIAVLVLGAGGSVHGETRSFSFRQWGSVAVDVPAGWSAEIHGVDDPSGPAIQFTPPGEVPLELLFSPLPLPVGTDGSQWLESMIERTRRKMGEIAVEHELPVHELRGSGMIARYVSATDRTVERPSNVDFKYCSQGHGIIGQLIVTFTILSNLKDAPEHTTALEIVRSAQHRSPGAPWRTPTGSVAAQFPGKTWRFALELPGFEMGPNQVQRGGQGVRLEGKNPHSKMMVTIYLAKAAPGSTASDRREEAWSRLLKTTPMERRDIRRSTIGDAAILEFFLPEFRGQAVRQHNVFAHLVRDGVQIDVHLSKPSFEEQDSALFDKVLASLRFEE